uniref:Uncharacterized protein n=1 Tax=Thermosporothrix sp. COM3 TaxID=2490863 RepID=A0A455SHF4_9CHLR|nr:hypothetical protein KTC_15490 [Thermosporothrix sp. COM3]
MTFTLTDIEDLVRLDLFDAGGSRWTNRDIDRAIEKAVTRYSEVAPHIIPADLATQPAQRSYLLTGTVAPPLRVDRVLYPFHIYGSAFPPPEKAVNAALSAGDGLSIGTYRYAVSYITANGETTPGAIATITTASGYRYVVLNDIPVAPLVRGTAGTPNRVIARNIYRSLVGDTSLHLLATLPDNATTTYVDTMPDEELSKRPLPPTVNTSGVPLWPQQEKPFAEQVTQNGILITLLIPPEELPTTEGEVIRVLYATRHQLDDYGSTIPEQHKELIILGASAYAMEAYQVPTNDNFRFQDGALGDRFDDTSVPVAWRIAALQKMRQFLEQLEQLRIESTSTAWVRWGERV